MYFPSSSYSYSSSLPSCLIKISPPFLSSPFLPSPSPICGTIFTSHAFEKCPLNILSAHIFLEKNIKTVESSAFSASSCVSTTIGIKHAVGALEAVEAVAAFLFCACAEGRRPLQRRNILLSKTCLRREYDVSHEDKERRKRRNISIRVLQDRREKGRF